MAKIGNFDIEDCAWAVVVILFVAGWIVQDLIKEHHQSKCREVAIAAGRPAADIEKLCKKED